MKRESFEHRSLNIPSFIFRDRSVSVMEALVKYLKEEQHLSFAQIATLLNRDDRTIWTVYDRARRKHERR